MLVILVLMAAAGAAGMNGYIKHAKQVARDSVARTVFMAAQTALTHEYNQDPEFYMHNRSPVLPSGDFLTATEADKLKHSPPALVYLVLNKGGANDTMPLYAMLSPYINDKALLYDSILIEYNRETGKVLSAFYSEVPEVTFGYGDAGSYNVANRDAESLAEGMVGYYGVDSTGEVIRPDPINIDDYRVRIIDHTDPREIGYYGLLTAEISIKTTELTTSSTNAYELDVIPMLGTSEILSFKYGPDAGIDFSIEELENAGIDTAEEAIENPRTITRTVNGQDVTRHIPVFYESGPVEGKILIVLDGVQPIGETKNIGIRTNFPGIAGGLLFGELVIEKGNTYSESVYSDDAGNQPVHAFYGYDSSEDITGSRLTVASVRHLNNIRYGKATDEFVQTQNIYMWDRDGQPLHFTPLCNRLDPVPEGQTDYGFYGSYTSSAKYAIYDLHIDLTMQTGIASTTGERGNNGDTTLYRAGLFDTIRSGARVANVRFAASIPVMDSARTRVLYYSDEQETAVLDAIACVRGIQYAGGIAAVNEGTIYNCTMLGGVYAVYDNDLPPDGCAGGIAGINSGTIERSATQCAVTAEMYAGGIAGQNTGAIRYCEAGTASWRGDSPMLLYASGVPQYGAAATTNGVYKGNYGTANNTFRVQIMEADGVSGGITATVSGSSAKVIGCVNACKVEAGNYPDGLAGNITGGIAGGIAGALNVSLAGNPDYVAIESCYNGGAVYATQYAGGLVGNIMSGRMYSCYNTGCVDREYGIATHNGAPYVSENITYYLPGITRNLFENGVNYAGGLVGYGETDMEIRYCYSAQYTGDRYGGAVGVVHEDASIVDCGFLRNILNSTTSYYTEKDNHVPKRNAFDDVNMYSVQTLLTVPSVEWANGSYLINGNLTNPSGVFKYKLPVIASAPSGNALPPHRTPYNHTIESYGRIDLSGTLTKGVEILCKFYLAPPEGYIYLRDGNQTASEGFLTCIPLMEESGHNSLRDLREASGSNAWHFIYGYDLDYDGYLAAPSTTQNYTFRIRARELSAAIEYDALRIAEGYSYEYQLLMVYDEQVDRCTPIPNTVKYLIAELYNTTKGTTDTTRYADADDLGNTMITLVNPAWPVKANVMRISGATVSATQTLEIEMLYHLAGGDETQKVQLTGAKLASAPDTYLKAMDGPWGTTIPPRVGFTFGAPSPDTLGSDRFPYYKETTGEIGLVLWTDNVSTNLQDAPRIRRKPNGLHLLDTGESVEVTVWLIDGSTTTRLARRSFRYWE